MPQLATRALELKDTVFANVLYDDYVEHYLFKLPNSQIYQRDQIGFLLAFAYRFHSGTDTFDLFLKTDAKVDSCTRNPGLSKNVVNYVIDKDEITTLTTKVSSEPNWKKLGQTIERKYGKIYVESNLLEARIKWYRLHQKWEQLAKWNLEKFKVSGVDTVGPGIIAFNNLLYGDFVLHAQNKKYLLNASGYLKTAVKRYADYFGLMDTYACLLYKGGKVQQALLWEGKAVKLAKNSEQYHEILANYSKMKSGQKIFK